MKPPHIELEKVRELGEPALFASIPLDWADFNGHMNMRWYVALFDDAGEGLHEHLGLTSQFHKEHGTGTMDLEHHTHFLREVIPGDEVSIYARGVDANAKRLHYLLFLVNETRGELASIFECTNAFVDLKIRRTAPWPAEVRERIDALVRKHQALEWPAPVSGAMSVG